MSDLTFGVAIKGTGDGSLVNDARASRDELVNLKKTTDDLAVSSGKMAGQMTGLESSVKAHGAAVRAASVPTVEFGEAAKSTAMSAGQLSMATRQLPMQFTDIFTSLASGQTPMMVLIQQGGQLKDSFGGVIPAASAMGGYMLGLINPITLVTATLAAGAYAWTQYETVAVESAEKTMEAIRKALGESRRIGSMGKEALDTEIADVEARIKTYEAYASHVNANITRFNWRDSAAQIALYNAEIEKTKARLGELKAARDAAAGKDDDSAADKRLKKEEAYTASLNKEFVKRLGLTYKEREENAKGDAAHALAIDASLAREQAKYDKLHQMAILSTASDEERVTWKLAFDLEQMDKEYIAATEHGRATAELEAAYQQARLERTAMGEAEIVALKKKSAEQQMKNEEGVSKFFTQLRHSDYTDAMSTAKNLTAGLATHSRSAFEINKAASTGEAIVHTYSAAMKAYDTAGGGWWGAAAAAASIAYGLAQVSAIQSTHFGGSGGSVYAPSSGGVPSLATTPGTPVNVQPPPTGTAAQSPSTVSLTLVGRKNPDEPRFTYNQIVNELIPLLNEAGANGVNIVVNA